MPGSKRRGYKQLNLAQLRSFCEVCRLGTYAGAARVLLLTSPAVWEQIQALERNYGIRLLERSGQGVKPTAAGASLLEMIRPVLAGLDSCRENLQQQDGALPKQLTLATNLRVLADDISRGLRHFQVRYPNLPLRVVYTGNDVPQRILDDSADVGFTLEPGPDASRSTAILYEPAGEVHYLLVTPPRHPLMRLASLHLRHVLDYALVVGEPTAYSRRRVQEVLHRYNLEHEAKIAVETSSDEYTMSCVRAGLGIGIAVGTGHGHLYDGLGVRSLRRWLGTARVGFLWKRGALVPPVQRALGQAIAVNLVQKVRH